MVLGLERMAGDTGEDLTGIGNGFLYESFHTRAFLFPQFHQA